MTVLFLQDGFFFTPKHWVLKPFSVDVRPRWRSDTDVL